MDVNGPIPDISLPEQQPIEYWWDPGSSPELTIVKTSSQHIYLDMDGRKSVFHNESVSPHSLIADISSSVTPNLHVLPRHRKRKSIFSPPPLPLLNLESIEEERGLSEYDCGYLDLGAETPNTSNFMHPAPFLLLPRRRSFRRASSPAATNRLSKYAVDRDCGICFEYAVLPCRTLCCGKVFCTEHLADWLHGPEAEGRCPNCENACSLAGGTLSLASPSELSSKRNNLAASSFSTLVKPHSNDTLMSSREGSHPQVASTKSSPSSTCSYSSTVDYSETTVSTEESEMIEEQHRIHHTFPDEEHMTNPFSPPWGIASRLISIVIFLMFLYKLRS